MILKTHRHSGQLSAAKTLRFLVIVPHRDARLPLRSWSGSLFAAGLNGAWSFPWAAPLAVLSHPFSAEELKHCARALRELTFSEGRDGKIKTGPVSRAAFPGGNTAVFGPVLDIAVPDSIFPVGAAGKILHRFSPPVLAAALVRPPETAVTTPAVPALSFRAEALANMVYRPLFAGDSVLSNGGYSFEWKIGKLCWLPASV